MLDSPTSLDRERCLDAVRTRDSAADGRFVFGVLTTGVYCRPSCPSRPALPDNMRFFASGEDARKSGLRPCKRCRPDEASAVERHRAAVEAACRRIEASDTTPSLAALAASAGLSRHHFHRVFTQIMGVTPGAYARSAKLTRIAGALDAGANVTEAVYAAGFGSPSRAYEAARAGLGMSPGTRLRKGAGETIRYAVTMSVLGPMLIAKSGRGICTIAFDDDPAVLRADLDRRFAAADLVEDDADLKPWIEAVAGHLLTPAHVLDLPLDIQGTAFQARVWQALRHIAPGDTASYSRIAEILGRPTAVRAVARACASNEIAVLIPCHRVVRQDGGLSGYRWSAARKAALLQAEARAVRSLAGRDQ